MTGEVTTGGGTTAGVTTGDVMTADEDWGGDDCGGNVNDAYVAKLVPTCSLVSRTRIIAECNVD